MRERTDFLIIGSGIAGLRAAADLTRHGSVTILTKADPTESNKVTRRVASRSRSVRTTQVHQRFPTIAAACQIAGFDLARDPSPVRSRGGHFRPDFPARDDLHWRIHVSQQRPV